MRSTRAVHGVPQAGDAGGDADAGSGQAETDVSCPATHSCTGGNPPSPSVRRSFPEGALCVKSGFGGCPSKVDTRSKNQRWRDAGGSRASDAAAAQLVVATRVPQLLIDVGHEIGVAVSRSITLCVVVRFGIVELFLQTSAVVVSD